MQVSKLDAQEMAVNQSLCELVENTVIPGTFSYCYERIYYRDFAATQGKDFEVYAIADPGGSLLGATQITFDQVYWNGQSKEVSYSGDTRVAPEARGRRIADQLIQASCLPSIRAGLPVLGAVLGSNELLLRKKLSDWKKIDVDFKVIGALKALLFRARSTASSSSTLNVRTANSNDLVPMFELWKSIQRHKNLARNYESIEEFQDSYQCLIGRSLEETIVVEDQSRQILGFLTMWNQSPIRKVRVKSTSRIMSVLAPPLKPWIRIPRAGEELKLCYAFQACVSYEKALIALISEAQSRSYQQGFAFFTMGFDERDFMYQSVKKMAMIENTVKIIAANAEPELNRLFHLEVGLG
jgi:hypothetical protein